MTVQGTVLLGCHGRPLYRGDLRAEREPSDYLREGFLGRRRSQCKCLGQESAEHTYLGTARNPRTFARIWDTFPILIFGLFKFPNDL